MQPGFAFPSGDFPRHSSGMPRAACTIAASSSGCVSWMKQGSGL